MLQPHDCAQKRTITLRLPTEATDDCSLQQRGPCGHPEEVTEEALKQLQNPLLEATFPLFCPTGQLAARKPTPTFLFTKPVWGERTKENLHFLAILPYVYKHFHQNCFHPKQIFQVFFFGLFFNLPHGPAKAAYLCVDRFALRLSRQGTDEFLHLL